MNKFMIVLASCCLAASALASSEVKLDTVKVGVDAPTVARGVEALMSDCHSCHSMKYIKYRDLVRLGVDVKKVDEWRGDQPLDASLMAQMGEADAMQAYGKAPPDLSLMTKARAGGANYVYSYLLGYYTTPDGTTKNHLFPDTKMPDVLGMSSAKEAAERSAIQGKARDIVSYLVWASDPHAQERQSLGYYVMGYLFVLTVMLYFIKNQIWAKLK